MENLHCGELVERAVRRSEYSISQLSKLMCINRRTVYNWFKQKRLKSETIFRIGYVINYDFSNEFTNLFTHDDFCFESKENGSINYWKDKYIKLLEEHNRILREKIK